MNSTAQPRSNLSYDMQQFPTLPGNIPVEIPPTATYNWPYIRTGAMPHGNITPNVQWNGMQNQNMLGGNPSGNLSGGANIPMSNFNPGITMQDTINVPTSSRLKKVRFLDRLGTNVYTQQYQDGR